MSGTPSPTRISFSRRPAGWASTSRNRSWLAIASGTCSPPSGPERSASDSSPAGTAGRSCSRRAPTGFTRIPPTFSSTSMRLACGTPRASSRHNHAMARAVWSGTISFGLVSVPVRLYPATRRKDVRFHEIDRQSGQRVHHQRVIEPAATWMPALESPAAPRPSSADGMKRLSRNIVPSEPTPPPYLPPVAEGRTGAVPQAVPSSDVLKGYEVAKDRYVTVQREELEELAPERTRSIDVEQFVEESAIDPLYYDSSYYAVPERDHDRAFGLLVDVMQETKRIAICWFVLRRKRYLAALRPHGRLMVLATMFHADEILPVGQLERATPKDLRRNEREMAALLIKTL